MKIRVLRWQYLVPAALLLMLLAWGLSQVWLPYRHTQQVTAEIEKLGGTVEYVDESMTSVKAEEALRTQQWTAATVKKHLDSEA